MTSKEFGKILQDKLTSEYGVELNVASNQQIYRSLALICRQMMSENHKKFQSKAIGTGTKQVYYLCMEFLMGRSLKTSLLNLGLDDVAKKALSDADINIDSIFEEEPDAGLGNGGLGRLAACYLDGMATTGICGTGYSILYEYGIFKQKIVDGWQQERADNWLPGGQVWLQSHPDQAVEVRFDGEIHENWDNGFHYIQHTNYNSVMAVPSDMYVQGYDGKGVAKLRLWQAKAPDFDMSSFSLGNYNTAMSKNANAELISKVLYPNDNHVEGKILRLRQQYFLSAASIGDIVQNHLSSYATLENLPDKVAIQLNDTHPTLAIPEMMRILLDECGFGWDKAFDICQKVFSYTNHTVMAEALEKWNEDLIERRLPRIYAILKEINQRFCGEMWNKFPGDWDKIERMSILSHGQARMANLSVVASHTVNGVSKLHSEIIKTSIFKDFNDAYPEKFTNVTNGIAHRRWLCQSNKELSSLLTECIGDGFVMHPEELAKFKAFENDESVLKRLAEIKRIKKGQLTSYVYKKTGFTLSPDSIFDVQAKRLHEYKRQLLNALYIINLYNNLKDNPEADVIPKTFIFGAKAAPGYYMAKRIIKLLCSIAEDLRKNPDKRIREKLNVIYLEDYNVTMAETLMPATEISEQISTAGKEASGTGNMKFMINGALTIGTLDGANVEMRESVGDENIFIFGMNAKQVENLWKHGYDACAFYNNNVVLQKVVASLKTGFAGERFDDIAAYLLTNSPIADPYMCMADFSDFLAIHDKADKTYKDVLKWNKMSLNNIAGAGIFSADRSIKEYAERIWHIKQIK